MAIDKTLASGSTPMLLLKLLSEKDMYGYEIIDTLRARSQNVFEMKAGTLYPLLHSLEAEGVYVSTGSACSSHKKRVSPVLLAHGVPQALAESAIRISLSPMNRMEDMEQAAEKIAKAVAHLRKFRRK